MASQSPRSIRATEVIHLVAHAEAHPRITWLTVTGAEGNLWLLGEYPCATRTCFLIERSTNAGATFVSVTSPPVSLPQKASGSYGVSLFEFANRDDGYFYVRSPRANLYWTGDGGESWQLVQPGGPLVWRNSPVGGPLVPSIVTTAGRAYVLVSGDCSNGNCKSLDLASSALTSDT
jgi:hypothetical protein